MLKFIEVTQTHGNKTLIPITDQTLVEENENGAAIRVSDSFGGLLVKETYDEVKEMIFMAKPIKEYYV